MLHPLHPSMRVLTHAQSHPHTQTPALGMQLYRCDAAWFATPCSSSSISVSMASLSRKPLLRPGHSGHTNAHTKVLLASCSKAARRTPVLKVRPGSLTLHGGCRGMHASACCAQVALLILEQGYTP